MKAVTEIARAGARLAELGWVPATSGNLSIRLDDGRIAVTASGRDKGTLGADDVLLTDAEGRPLVAGCRPSAETGLHCAIYRIEPAARAVVHAHASVAAILTRLDPSDAIRLQGWEMEKAFQGIDTHEAELLVPVFDNAQDIASLARLVEARLRRPAGRHTPAFILRGHGFYAWGRDMDAALRHAEALEYLLSCELRLRELSR